MGHSHALLGLFVGDAVGILVGLQRRVPHPRAPVGPAADLALVGFVDEDARDFLLNLIVKQV